jgi:hypothetical protein
MMLGGGIQALKRYWENTTFFGSSRAIDQGNGLAAKDEVMVPAPESDSGVMEN